jgi:MFS family permease
VSSATAAAATRAESRAIGLISAGHFMSHFYQLTLPPLFVFIKPDLGVTYAALGLLMTAFFVATAVAQVPVGMLVDRIGARRVLIAGLVLMSGAVALAGLMNSYAALLALFLVAGLGNAVFHPADFAILSATVQESRLGRAFGIHTFGGSIGYAAAPLTLGLFTSLWDWRAAVGAVGIIGLAIAAVIALSGDTLRDPAASGGAGPKGAADGKPGEKPSWRFMLSRPMVMFFLFYACISASGTGMTNFSVVALIEVYGTTLAAANSALTVFLVAAMVGTLPGGYLADWTRRHDLVLVICFLVMAASVAAIGTASLPLWLILVAVTAAGLMRGVYNASRDMLVKQTAPDGRIGSAFGFVTLGYSLGQGGTPVIYGWLMDIGAGSAVFYLSAVFALLAIATVLTPKRRGASRNRDLS